MPYRIVVAQTKERWYWASYNQWTNFSPNARLYKTEGMAQGALTRMSRFNQKDAYIEPAPTHKTVEKKHIR